MVIIMLSERDLQKLNEQSVGNMELFEKEQKCGCFFCGKIFGSEEITQYIEDEEGDTAVCPFCKTDSVLGESCGYEITEELLKEMHDYWF
ncbi:MAG: cytoplasmic protein [Oscillospiraceae bacterium]|nr:cytoplasmic protein [Oscillospiraceae bacterium]MDD7293321.1 cytoplasmic protein [Clostridiaceae bacterium]MDY5991480.1 cytoplasmic protein [Oscillospiraceae bacterium]